MKSRLNLSMIVLASFIVFIIPLNAYAFTITNGAAANFANWAATPGVKVVKGDFNGDGKTDIALVNQSATAGWITIPVAFAKGDGNWNVTNVGTTFFTQWALTSNGNVVVLSGDFNGDGKTDIALVNQSATANWASIPVAFSNGDGSWRVTNQSVGTFATWAATPGVIPLAYDFNGDGLTDVALVRQTSGWATIPIALSKGDGTWTITNNGVGDFATWAATPGVKVLTGDFDTYGEGHADITLIRQMSGWATMPVSFSRNGGTWQITNNSTGDFATWAATPGVVPLTGDFNGDGRTDVALLRKTAGWATMPLALTHGPEFGRWLILNNSIGDFATWAATPGVVPLTGDFNGDGLSDVALLRQTAGWNTMPVALSVRNGQYNTTWSITNNSIGDFATWAATPGVVPLTGDFNGDGRTDVVLIRQTTGWASMPIAFW